MLQQPRILAVGVATLDIVNTVADYPAEDSEVRILQQQMRRGGNASNTLVVLSQLGFVCDWAGVWVDDADGALVRQDLQSHRVNMRYCRLQTRGKMPTSYVLLSQATGSRSISHYRDLAEFQFADFKKIDLTEFDCLHFEGRNVAQLRLMLAWTQQQRPQLKLSLEVEKPRAEIETLFDAVDVLLFSRQFVLSQGFVDAPTFLRQMQQRHPRPDLVCAWGEGGAYALASQQHSVLFCPAYPIDKVVDSVGAGDVFNAALLAVYLRGGSLAQALNQACRLAAAHCAVFGLLELCDCNTIFN